MASAQELARTDGMSAESYSSVHGLKWLLAEWPDAAVTEEPAGFHVNIDGDRGVVVILRSQSVEIRLPTIEWHGPHTPVTTTRLWKRAPTAGLTPEDLKSLVCRGLRARRGQFRKCRYCGREVPVEHRFSTDVCHGCAEKHLGVCF